MAAPEVPRYHVRVCRGPECGERHGSRRIYEALRAAIAERGLGGRVELAWQSCFGRCTQGPNLLVRELPGGVSGTGDAPGRTPATALYTGVDVVHVDAVIQQHVERGVVVGELIRRPLLAVPRGLASRTRSDDET